MKTYILKGRFQVSGARHDMKVQAMNENKAKEWVVKERPSFKFWECKEKGSNENIIEI